MHNLAREVRRSSLSRSSLLSLSLGTLMMIGDAGCGGSGDIPIGELQARALDATCRYSVRCGQFPDMASCEGTLFTKLQLFADVNAGTILYDGHAAADCLQEFATAACTISNGGSVIEDLPSCQAMFTGTVANGASCFDSPECISRNCDSTACGGVLCCPGTCQALVPVGGDCSGTGARCVDSASCKKDPAGGSGICVARVAAGQPCTSSVDCVSGKACIRDSAAATSGTCRNPPAEGERCFDGVCDAIADACPATTKTCVRKVAVGQPCSPAGAPCVGYASCDPATLTCVSGVRPGATGCSDSVKCIDYLQCQNGTCISPADVPACK